MFPKDFLVLAPVVLPAVAVVVVVDAAIVVFVFVFVAVPLASDVAT